MQVCALEVERCLHYGTLGHFCEARLIVEYLRNHWSPHNAQIVDLTPNSPLKVAVENRDNLRYQAPQYVYAENVHYLAQLARYLVKATRHVNCLNLLHANGSFP